jgi:hypothetical protein
MSSKLVYGSITKSFSSNNSKSGSIWLGSSHSKECLRYMVLGSKKRFELSEF